MVIAIAHVQIAFREGAVGGRSHIHAVGSWVAVGVEHFPFGIGCELGDVGRFTVVAACRELDGCPGHRLSALRIHHHQTQPVVGQCFVEHIEVAHIEQGILWFHSRGIALHLHQISPKGQTAELERIAQHLPGLFSRVAMFGLQGCEVFHHALLQTGELFLVAQLITVVTCNVYFPHGDGKSLQVAPFAHFHRHGHPGQQKVVCCVGTEHRRDDVFPFVAQPVERFQCRPPLQQRIDKCQALAGGFLLEPTVVLGVFHPAGDGSFLVSHTLIIGVEGFVGRSLEANHMQQVVAEDVAVDAPHH